VSRVTNLEKSVEANQQLFKQFDERVCDCLYNPKHTIIGLDEPIAWRQLADEHDPEYAKEHDRVFNDESVPEADNYTPDSINDQYLNLEIAFPADPEGEARLGRVVKRARGEAGLPVGRAHEEPRLDTRLNEVEYLNGSRDALSANIIAENVVAQLDNEGHQRVLLKEIVGHNVAPTALTQQEAWITSATGVRSRRPTTKGWSLQVEWRNGTQSVIPLKDAKNSFLIEVAENAVAAKIAKEPAFVWWVPQLLSTKDRIVSKVRRSKYWTRTHKFGIDIPKSVDDAIRTEMRNVRPAFEVWDKSESEIPVGYQRIWCHMIFDVKMGENFRRKALFVAGGHTTETPASITYASVVSCDSVQLALLIALLNNLQVVACDIQNAYLTADCHEKIYTIAGTEFGSEKGTIM
jgi:hypothetical protein